MPERTDSPSPESSPQEQPIQGLATIPIADWLQKGNALFGQDFLAWKFRCPVCGNIQSLKDFRDRGIDPHMAYQECIGRKLPKSQRASNLGGTPGQNGATRPCDYAAYGLFRGLGAPLVIAEDGHTVAVLPFAEETPAPRTDKPDQPTEG